MKILSALWNALSAWWSETSVLSVISPLDEELRNCSDAYEKDLTSRRRRIQETFDQWGNATVSCHLEDQVGIAIADLVPGQRVESESCKNKTSLWRNMDIRLLRAANLKVVNSCRGLVERFSELKPVSGRVLAQNNELIEKVKTILDWKPRFDSHRLALDRMFTAHMRSQMEFNDGLMILMRKGTSDENVRVSFAHMVSRYKLVEIEKMEKFAALLAREQGCYAFFDNSWAELAHAASSALRNRSLGISV